MAFKMKGSPMYRNFGVGSPAKKNGNGDTDPKKAKKSESKRTFTPQEYGSSSREEMVKTYGQNVVDAMIAAGDLKGD